MSQQNLFPTQPSGLQASPAKTSPSPEWENERGCEENNQVSFLNLFAYLKRAFPKLLSSKTCTVSSLATEDETSQSYSKRWTNSGMVWRGECLTVSTLESPSLADEPMLLPLIETQDLPQKYFLSPNAATGILRRVERMGRNLPASFKQSLEILARGHS